MKMPESKNPLRQSARIARLVWRSSAVPVGLVLGVMLGVSGCAQNPAKPEAAATPTESSPSVPEAAAPVSEAPAPLMPLKEIIALVENGKDDAARAALKTFLKKDPKNPQAISLQRQLTTAPRQLLGGAPTVKYTIQNGDTLGGLAQKYLGSSLKFVALARYNHIQRSRDVQVGQVIEVPAQRNSGATIEPEATAAVVAEPEISAASIAVTHLPSASSPAQAASKPRDNPPAEEPVPSAPPETASKPAHAANRLASAPASDDAKSLEQRGMAAYKQKNWETAYAALSSAVAAAPGIEPATSTLATVKPKLVRQYHEQALVDFRQQSLDQAIALWDKALAIDPNYEPALGYRARALELQHRLKQLEQK